jgi:FkbM family methyltransferase
MGYSQYGEDDLFLPLLPEHGRLLDVGAGPVKQFSNSRVLIERGWEAVLIEGSPHYLLQLFEEYRSHERVQLVHAIVHGSDHLGFAAFHYNDEMVSTISEKHFEVWRDKATFLGQYLTPVVPLQFIVDQFKPEFDFVSIDVEGRSADMITTAVAANPKVICIEHDGRQDWVMEQAPGYRQIFRNGVNLVLVR